MTSAGAGASLVPYLSERHAEVRALAAQALAAVGHADAGACRALIDALKDSDQAVRDAAGRALGSIYAGRRQGEEVNGSDEGQGAVSSGGGRAATGRSIGALGGAGRRGWQVGGAERGDAERGGGNLEWSSVVAAVAKGLASRKEEVSISASSHDFVMP